jgi:hypothetical protein
MSLEDLTLSQRLNSLTKYHLNQAYLHFNRSACQSHLEQGKKKDLPLNIIDEAVARYQKGGYKKVCHRYDIFLRQLKGCKTIANETKPYVD